MRPRPRPRMIDGLLLLGVVLAAIGLGLTAAPIDAAPDLRGISLVMRGVVPDMASAAIPPDDRSAGFRAMARPRPDARDAAADARRAVLASPFRLPANVRGPRGDSNLRSFLLASAS